MQDPLIGTLLGNTYRVVRLLGQGAMGSVYEANHESLSRRVALKVMAPAIAQMPTAIERLRREATAAARLTHPNIAAVTDFRAEPGEPAFLVMEFIEGVSLEDAMEREGPMRAQRVASLGVQLLAALEVAHAAGVIHRDIKPANMMLVKVAGAGEVLRVLDFGIAKIAGSQALTTEGSLIGSPLYMAPEQAFSDAVDARADLYAAGATLYHAASGSPPIDADTLPRLLAMIREHIPAPLAARTPHIDSGLGAVIDRALAKDPEQRFGSAAAMRDALMPYCDAVPNSAVLSREAFARTEMGVATEASHAPALGGHAAGAVSGGAMAISGFDATLPPPATLASPTSGVSASSSVLAGSVPGVAHTTPGVDRAAALMAPGGAPKRSAFAPITGGLLALAAVAGGGAYVMRNGTSGAVGGANSAGQSGAAVTVQPTGIATKDNVTTAPAHSALVPTASAPGARGLVAAPALSTAAGRSSSASALVDAPAARATPSSTAAPSPAGRSYRTNCYFSQRNHYADGNALAGSAAQLGAALNRCAPQGCYDGGTELSEYYNLNVDIGGQVTAVSHPADSCKAMDPCALGILRGALVAKPDEPAQLQMICRYSIARPKP
jgi:eukaryotic-like serine/threonine-protein kinase